MRASAPCLGTEKKTNKRKKEEEEEENGHGQHGSRMKERRLNEVISNETYSPAKTCGRDFARNVEELAA